MTPGDRPLFEALYVAVASHDPTAPGIAVTAKALLEDIRAAEGADSSPAPKPLPWEFSAAKPQPFDCATCRHEAVGPGGSPCSHCVHGKWGSVVNQWEPIQAEEINGLRAKLADATAFRASIVRAIKHAKDGYDGGQSIENAPDDLVIEVAFATLESATDDRRKRIDLQFENGSLRSRLAEAESRVEHLRACLDSSQEAVDELQAKNVNLSEELKQAHKSVGERTWERDMENKGRLESEGKVAAMCSGWDSTIASLRECMVDLDADEAVIHALVDERRKNRHMVRGIIEAAEEVGWNGLENSKTLQEFIRRLPARCMSLGRNQARAEMPADDPRGSGEEDELLPIERRIVNWLGKRHSPVDAYEVAKALELWGPTEGLLEGLVSLGYVEAIDCGAERTLYQVARPPKMVLTEVAPTAADAALHADLMAQPITLSKAKPSPRVLPAGTVLTGDLHVGMLVQVEGYAPDRITHIGSGRAWSGGVAISNHPRRRLGTPITLVEDFTLPEDSSNV